MPCSYQQQPGAVSFSLAASFSAGAPTVTINVPYSEFIWNAGNDNCYLGAWYDASVSIHILGDTFLRGAYVVFDQDSDALYMADYVACGGAGAGASSDGGGLVSVPAGQDAVLSIRGNCVPAGGAAGNGGASSSSVVLPGGPVTSSGLGPSVVPTINPAGPASVTSSATASGTAGTTTAAVPGNTPATSSVLPGGVSSLPGSVSSQNSVSTLPGASATPAPTQSTGPGFDPNAVPAGGSGAATSATPAAGGLPVANNPDPNFTIPGGAGTAGIGGTGTGTMSGTITRTVTNLIVATVTACPSPAVTSGAACVLGQVTTRTSVYVTTICPEETANPVPASAGAGAAVTAPAPAMGGGAGAGAGAAAAAGPGGAQAPPQQGVGAVFVTVSEACHTSTYAVTSCAPNAAGCTVGMTTTQMYTEYRTVTATAPAVQAVQTMPGAAGTPGGGVVGGNVGYSPSSGTALPPAVQIGGGGVVSSVEAGPYSNSSSGSSFSSSNDNLSGGGYSSSSSSSSGGNGASAACAGASCAVVAAGSVPTTTMPVYAGAVRSTGAVKAWWTAVGIGALFLVLGAS